MGLYHICIYAAIFVVIIVDVYQYSDAYFCFGGVPVLDNRIIIMYNLYMKQNRT